MSPTLRQFRYFIATADAGQVSKAAMEINVSQSAITTAIRSLEQVVGTALFDRHAGGVHLTYEGRLFLNHARNIIGAVDEAVRIPHRVRQDVHGTIDVAVTYTVAGYFLPPLLSRFSATFPNVVVNLTEADRPAIESGVMGGKFDIAVMLVSNLENDKTIAHRTLLRSRRRLWVAGSHPFLQRDRITLRDIAKEPYIMLTVDEASNTAQRYWDRTKHRPHVIFRTSSVEAVRSIVASGMGISILSDMVYRQWSLEGKRVGVMPVHEPIPTMDVGLAWARGSDWTPARRAFADFMELAETD